MAERFVFKLNLFEREKKQTFGSLTLRIHFKVADSYRIFSKTWSDNFRSVLIYGKEQESQKNIS